MIEVTDEMLALLREYQMGAYGEMDDFCDKHIIAALIERHEASKWVSVEDGLPPDDGEVNVRYRSGNISSDCYSHRLNHWKFMSCNSCVTHWQPLPEFKE